jgi:type II secretory pathway pseudopilin PulG
MGYTWIDLLCSLSIMGTVLTYALPLPQAWVGRSDMMLARQRFEQDWRRARWSAQIMGQTVRLQPITSCLATPASSGWPCGWQTVVESSGLLLKETRLPSGLSVSTKPSDTWRIDAWGEPLSGGASIMFQSNLQAALAPELLCMNLLGRLRRLQGTSCSE